MKKVVERKRAPRGVADIAGLAAVTACVLLALWPLVSLGTLVVTSEAGGNDSLTQGYPFRMLMAQSLSAGHLPLWTDRFFTGYPLLANPAVGVFYPPNWLFLALPPAAAMGLLLLGSCLLAGWGAYAFARSLGASPAGSGLAGMSFGVCGFMVSHLKHPGLLCSAAWLPWQLLVVERAVTAGGRPGVRQALWLAPVTALQVLAGGPQVVAISLLAVAAYAIVRLAGMRRPGRLTVAAALAVSLGLAVAMSAVQILPSMELAGVSERSHGLANADPWPMPLRDLLTLGWSGAVGRAGDGSYWSRPGSTPSVYAEDYAYAGSLVCLLAAVGLPWTLRRGGRGAFFLALAVAGALLALGERGLLLPLLNRLPGFGLFRFPQRFLLLTELSLAMLAALAWTRLAAFVPERHRWAAVVVAGGASMAGLVGGQSLQNQYYDAGRWLERPSTLTAIADQPAAGTGSRVHAVQVPRLYRAIIRQGGPERNLTALYDLRGLPAPCTGALWGVTTPGGYADLCTREGALLWYAHHGRSLASIFEKATGRGSGGTLVLPEGYLQFLGAADVGWVISPWPLSGSGLARIASPQWYVYRNRRALGRAYLVAGAERLSDEDFLRKAAAGGLRFDRTVYLAGGEPTPAGFRAIPVPVAVGESGQRVTLHPRAPAPAWLVLADAWYPGWSVTVDGRPAELVRANVNSRAVRVPAGRHEVVFRYRCRPLERGAVISGAAALTWLLALGGLTFGGRRRDLTG